VTTATALPHWDMTTVYPSLESAEFDEGFRSYVGGVDDLVALFDRYDIARHDRLDANEKSIEAVEGMLKALSRITDQGITLRAYIMSFVTTDSRNALAQAKMSELSQRSVVLSQLYTRFTAWIGSLDVERLIEASSAARQHDYMLRLEKEEAEHLMSPDQEHLAAELEPSSGTAWTRLHGNITSQIMVPVQTDAGIEDLPMSQVRNLAMDPDRDRRRRAYEGELKAWEQAAVPLAASLNSIKGESNVLDRRRKWESPLDAALFNNHIDRDTLSAMMRSAAASFPDFRRYLRAKARLIGAPGLAWYDIFAPVGSSERTWEYPQASAFIVDQFATYSQRLSDFAARAFKENWIDAEPRPGKRDGAFCMKLRAGESRILANFSPTYDGMSTLAHELGHGYHNLNLVERPVLLRTAPMTLAETASIFCQTLIKEAVLKDANRAEQISILEASLQDQNQVVVDITSRFLFEQRLFEAREQRELSIEELNELMLQTQRETYGDGLDQNLLHPYMWAVKGHYYSVGGPYYNYPYMFGLLFGLGLYAQYQQSPHSFREGYDDLLSATGTADAATLAGRFGIDIRSRSFWDASLDIIRADVDRFERLVDDAS
jgi:oligoendopeptidase F